MRQQKELKSFRGHEESVRCAVFLSQTITCKRIILSVSDDKTIRLWSMEDNSKFELIIRNYFLRNSLDTKILKFEF